MQKQATSASPEILMAAASPQTHTAPSLLSIKQFCQVETAFSPGGLRHLFFSRGHDLPGVIRFGRRVLISREEFIQGIKAGSASVISGQGGAQ